jgi:hypothetical protein
MTNLVPVVARQEGKCAQLPTSSPRRRARSGQVAAIGELPLEPCLSRETLDSRTGEVVVAAIKSAGADRRVTFCALT